MIIDHPREQQSTGVTHDHHHDHQYHLSVDHPREQQLTGVTHDHHDDH